jgi:hypothetical protein
MRKLFRLLLAGLDAVASVARLRSRDKRKASRVRHGAHRRARRTSRRLWSHATIGNGGRSPTRQSGTGRNVEAGRAATVAIPKGASADLTRPYTPGHSRRDVVLHPVGRRDPLPRDGRVRITRPDRQSGAYGFPPGLAAPPVPRPMLLPARPRWLLADIPASVAVGTDVSLLVRVGESPLHASRYEPLKAFTVGSGGVKVTLIVQAPYGLLATEPLEQTLLVPESGNSEPVRFGFRAATVGLFELRINAFVGGTGIRQSREWYSACW